MTDSIAPATRPEIARGPAIEMAKPYLLPEDKVFLLGRRGYYRDSMGVSGHNDINIYDDAICIVTPTRIIPYNANTDPSKRKQDMATLQPGRWLYAIGTHGLSRPASEQYEALVQAGDVIVHREGTELSAHRYDAHLGYHMGFGLWKGQFGINIHRGGKFTSTGSEGCQTIFKPQWGDFIEKVKSTMRFYEMVTIPYILTARDDA